MAIFGKLGKYSDFGLLAMRAGLGVMMMVHGYPKLMGGTDTWQHLGAAMANLGVHSYPLFWGFMAAVAEAIGGLLLLLGLFFRPATLLLMFTMLVAVISHFHKGDSLGDASHAIELGFTFLGLLFLGPGKYSVDKS